MSFASCSNSSAGERIGRSISVNLIVLPMVLLPFWLVVGGTALGHRVSVEGSRPANRGAAGLLGGAGLVQGAERGDEVVLVEEDVPTSFTFEQGVAEEDVGGAVQALWRGRPARMPPALSHSRWVESGTPSALQKLSASRSPLDLMMDMGSAEGRL
jgi:hypothetical protein